MRALPAPVLLTDSLPETGTTPASAEQVLAELASRLAAVEDLVAVLSGQTAAIQDAAIARTVRQLEGSARKLRDVVDALRVS
jgi:uncharacterized coiled-coil protein SlyX